MKTLIAAAALLWASSALANPTCIVILPTDQVGDHQSVQVTELHERTHCKGWTHGDDVNDIRNIIPSAEWQRKPWPKGMKLLAYRFPTAITEKICMSVNGGVYTYACQWMDDNDQMLQDTKLIVALAQHPSQ